MNDTRNCKKCGTEFADHGREGTLCVPCAFAQSLGVTTDPRPAYRRIRHAAHYPGMSTAQGHDLETWTVKAEGRSVSYRFEGIPPTAEFHSGQLIDGVQYYTYVLRAPMSPGLCQFCS